MNQVNTSVLVIDDEEMVRDNIEEILVPRKVAVIDSNISKAASILFDTPQEILIPRTSKIPVFTVDKAANGMDGVELVKKSIAANQPYAVIFLDIRMPGWDGVETAMQIRKHDSQAEIIFITAYSDRSIEDIVDKAGQNVGYHCKPYAAEEIILLATKAITDYDRLRSLEKLIESISSIGLNEHQLNALFKNILEQLAMSVGTDMALLGKLNDDFSYEKILSIGAIDSKINLDELITRVKTIKIEPDEVVQQDELVLARLDSYSVFAVLQKQEKLKTEKMYLLKLFVQNAAQAIRNAELTEKLIQKEKLSIVGKAIGMVMHDLRSPIKNMRIITTMMQDENEPRDLIPMLDQCAVQASEIFEDFLDFIRESPVKKETVNFKYVIETAVNLALGTSNQQQIAIHMAIPADLVAQLDERKIKRAVMNLLNNALEVLQNKKIAHPVIRIIVSADEIKDQLSIMIRDNGPGIDPEIIKTLFEPFVTTNKNNGTGLGLAIVKQCITAHGGTIIAENDQGAVFTIHLPYK
ncbi:hybrid sensor histidine kinase/response regulator [Pedobacter hiemivivus]|uniref:histidine kinase n=1 Tax=Pedobacter hiemivivus TaxID=2530454 RepID=A0A4U1GLG8_9SPHI|nr:hybrid sensor histidine kinase/response regulator [Pedobacter hiemivivus]TKC62432.1 hybrid sensor histidine kinase/response regulator [Pedobacter hiemivivus]